MLFLSEDSKISSRCTQKHSNTSSLILLMKYSSQTFAYTAHRFKSIAHQSIHPSIDLLNLILPNPSN